MYINKQASLPVLQFQLMNMCCCVGEVFGLKHNSYKYADHSMTTWCLWKDVYCCLTLKDTYCTDRRKRAISDTLTHSWTQQRAKLNPTTGILRAREQNTDVQSQRSDNQCLESEIRVQRSRVRASKSELRARLQNLDILRRSKARGHSQSSEPDNLNQTKVRVRGLAKANRQVQY